ncbi:MAG: hypothetical protein ACREKS_02680 [Candidatus Rokuibacteriota bacterium]
MRQHTSWRASAAVLGALGLLLQSCTIPVNRAVMESLLIKAGFQVKRADNPDRLAHLKTLTPLKLVRHERNGVPYYVFADPDGCQCVYVGNEAAYQQFQKLAHESQLESERRAASLVNPDGPMSWGVWDPFFW